MVWLHGGGYSVSQRFDPVYDGTQPCQRGDVVVVTLNHRLNLFGYLYLADLAGDRFANSGDVGQLDIIAAFDGCATISPHFGGDPGRVMIFGESGGGGKVSTLMAMPAAKGLFHRATIQSGPGLIGIKPEAATETARAICRAVGVSGEGRGCAPARASRSAARRPEDRHRGHADGLRTGGGRAQPAARSVQPGRARRIGRCSGDRRLQRHPRPRCSFPPAGAFDLDWAGLKPALAARAQGADVDKLITDFRRLRPNASPSDLYFTITTEAWMGAGSRTLAERKSAQGAAAAYLYRLDLETPVQRLRSPHSLDLPLVFDNVARSASLLGAAAPDAQKVADQMSAAWIAFAHTGSPNGTGLSSWPRYDTRSRSTMLFNVVSRAVNDPNSEERQIIAALPAGRGV